jgi:hypothetical protein
MRSATASVWRNPYPDTCRVKAYIVWGGYTNKNPVRATTLENLNLTRMVDAFGRGDDGEMVRMFAQAILERYGVTVDFDEVESLTFEYRGENYYAR